MRTIQDALTRLRAEFLEMPGLRLKKEQVQRLCGLEREPCQAALDSLIAEQFLCLKVDGHYARMTEGEIPRPRTAKADVRAAPGFLRAS